MKKIFQILLLLAPLSIWAQKPILTIQNGHQTQIRYGAMSPNNAYIISIDGSGTAILWDVALSKQLKSFTDVFAAEFAADSRSIFVAAQNGKFRQIDLNGKPMNTWSLSSFDKLDSWNRWFFPESGILLLNGYLHNFKTGKSQRFQAKQWGVQQGFSPAKNLVGIGGKGFLTLSDATDGHQIKEIPLAIPKTQSAFKVEFSRDGNLVLVGEKSVYQLIDVNTGNILQTFNHNDEAIFGATFSADGKKAIIASVKNFYIWNVQTGALIKKIAHDCSENSRINLAFQTEETFKLSPDGHKILYAGGSPMRLEVFNAETLTLEKKMVSVINGGVETMFMSADSKILSAKAAQTQLLHWNLTTGALEKPVTVPSSTNGKGYIALSDNAKTFLNAGPLVSSIKETDGYTGAFRGDFSTEDPEDVGGIHPIYFSQDQKYVVGIMTDKSNEINSFLCAWAYPSRKLVLKKPCAMETMALANKTNIAVVKSSWESPILNIVELPSGKVLGEFDSKKKTMGSVGLKFSNNDKLLALFVDNVYQIMNFENKTIQSTCKVPSGYVTDYTFSPDDKYFLMGTSEGNVYVFNAENGQLESTLQGHTGGVQTITFLKNGKFIFINGRGDNQIKLWNFRTKDLAATLYALNKEGDWAVTCPDGRFEATKTAMESMYYVKDLTVTPLESLFEKFYSPNLLPRILEEEKLDPIPVDVNTLKEAPTVKISLENLQRNLVVDDDMPTYSVDKEQVTLKVQADCPSDAVTEIRLFQNGKLVQTTRNLVVEDENTEGVKSMAKTFTVVLSDGENRFKAIAFNTQRTESRAAEMVLNFKKPKLNNTNSSNTEGGISLHLMVIGINKYKNPKYNLNYATADATSFKEAIEKGGATIFTKINVVFIGDDKATKAGISTEFEKLKTTANPQDVFIFYYAGHGVLNEKKDFFLVPHDVTQLYGQDEALAQKGLSANQLQQFSKDIKAQKQLFILDACQSAGALSQIVAARGAAEEKAIAQLARSTGTHWLTASGSEQFASEFTQLGHGTFTYVLLEALSGKADTGDKKITVKEIDAYLQEQVPEVTAKYKGTPQYPASYGFGNDFPIGVVKQ